MDLHLHLTFAFRALDCKWGQPVDLDTTEDSSTGAPASIDHSFTTFSSEDYLRTMKRQRRERPKPYSKKRRARNDDSLTNISVHRIPSVSDLGGSISLLNTSGFSDVTSSSHLSRSLSVDRGFVDITGDGNMDSDTSDRVTKEPLEDPAMWSKPVLDEKKKEVPVGIFYKLKKIAVTLVEGKCKRKC